MIESSSVNRAVLVVAVLLAAGIGWIAIQDREPILVALALGLLIVGPFVRRSEGARPNAVPVARVDRLQPFFRLPAAGGAGDEAGSIPGLSPQVRAQILAGNKIGAIKRYRDEYGSGLKEAKDAVEAFELQLAQPR